MQGAKKAAVAASLCIVGSLVAFGCSGGGGGGGGGAVPVTSIGGAGGSVTANGVTVVVPASAVTKSVEISVTPGFKVASGAFVEAGNAFLLGPTGTTFASPVTVTLPYDPSKIPSGQTPADLVVLHRNDTTGNITTIKPSSVDTSKQTVTFTLTSFSTVQAALPAVVDAAKSTVVVIPSSVIADGSQKSTIQVAAKNAAGEPFPGVPVVLSATGSQNTLVQPSVTDAQGQASGTLASTVVETKTISVTAGGVVLATKPTVTFTSPFAATLRITGPLPLERVPSSTTLRITWTSSNVNETVNLSVSTDGGASYTLIGSGLASVSSTTWTPPAGTTRARLKLVSASGLVQDTQAGDFGFMRVWFVDNQATGIADGESWATAITSIQAAIDVASFGEQVWVANKAAYTSGSTEVVRLKTGVDIVGGFTGVETSLSQRTSSTRTTIDGQDLRRCVLGNTGGTTTIDGLRLFRGRSFSAGGGLLATLGSMVVRNCAFDSNQAPSGPGGGAQFVFCPSVTIQNCSFTSNVAGCGGALQLETASNTLSTTVVQSCSFDQNKCNTSMSSGGGAVATVQAQFNVNAKITFDSCAFTQNTSDIDAGALLVVATKPVITGCTFTSNTAKQSGGAIHYAQSRPDISLSTFTSNSVLNTTQAAEGGGALMLAYVNGGAVKQCSFFSNSAPNGGAVLVKGLDFGPGNPQGGGDIPLFENCVFGANTATVHGGGILTASAAFSKWSFCTMSGNNPNALTTMNGVTSTILSSILFGNVSGPDIAGFDVDNVSTTVTASNSIVNPLLPGVGNSNVAPTFVAPGSLDFHLQAGSAGINSGSTVGAPTVDRDGKTRDAQPDIGAYER